MTEKTTGEKPFHIFGKSGTATLAVPSASRSVCVTS
jgi:hypothetical protein